MSDDKKTLKFQMMMTPAEAEILDDWMFANRVRSRAEAIRRLWHIGMSTAAKINEARSMVEWSQGWAEEAFNNYAKAHGIGHDIRRPLPADTPEFMHNAKVASDVASVAVTMLNRIAVGADLPDLPDLSTEVDDITEQLKNAQTAIDEPRGTKG